MKAQMIKLLKEKGIRTNNQEVKLEKLKEYEVEKIYHENYPEDKSGKKIVELAYK